MALPTGGAARFTQGVALPLRALAYLGARPALWPYAVLPVLVTIAGIVAGFLVSLPLSRWLLELVWSEPQGWMVALWGLSRVALVISLVVALALVLPAVVSAPFSDLLSAKVEELELGPAGPGGIGRAIAETWRGAVNSLVRGLALLAGLALLLPAALVPLLYPALAFLWTARWTAVQWLDLPMARNLHTVGEARQALRAVRPMGGGMGAVLTLAVAVPFFDFLVVPIGAVAGTLLYCDLVRAGLTTRAGGDGAAASRTSGPVPAPKARIAAGGASGGLPQPPCT